MSPQPFDREDGSLEDAIAECQRVEVPESPSAGLFLARLIERSAARNPLAAPPRRPPSLLLGRRSVRITAAVSLIAIAAVAWMNLTESTQSAIAQVIKSTTTHRLVRYKIHKSGVFTGRLKESIIGNANNYYVAYTDLKMPRMRLETPVGKTLNEVGEQSGEEILDYAADRYLIIWRFDLIMAENDAKTEIQRRLIRDILAHPQDKSRLGPHRHDAKLSGAPRPDTLNKKRLLKPYDDIGKDVSFLETLRTLQTSKQTVFTREQVDGCHATKYQLREPDWTSVVWVDAKTKLPIRIEYELVGEATGKDLASIKWIYTDFEWDPKVRSVEALFSTKPPEGYTFEDHTNDKRLP